MNIGITSVRLAAVGTATGGGGGATQLTITTQPSAWASTGLAIDTQPVLQLRDSGGNAVSQAGVSVAAAINSGGGTLGGTTSVATNGSGVATFTNLAITGGDVNTLAFSSAGLTGVNSGTINTPDILDNFAFPSGFGTFQNFSGGSPSIHPYNTWDSFARDNTTSPPGATWAVKYGWVSGQPGTNFQDAGADFMTPFYPTNLDRVWTRFYFKLNASMVSGDTIKFCRFTGTGVTGNLGGLYLLPGSRGVCFNTDTEDSAVQCAIGIPDTDVTGNGYHSIELDYWHVGDTSGNVITTGQGEISALFYLDGVQKYQTLNGPTFIGSNGYWKNGKFYSGTRTGADGSRQLRASSFFAVNNVPRGNVGDCSITRVSISTRGRIGP